MYEHSEQLASALAELGSANENFDIFANLFSNATLWHNDDKTTVALMLRSSKDDLPSELGQKDLFREQQKCLSNSRSRLPTMVPLIPQ